MTLLPLIEKKRLLSEKTVVDHLNIEKKYETESIVLTYNKLGAQDFIKYANIWWDDYKNIRNSHTTRSIKVFVPTEDREN